MTYLPHENKKRKVHIAAAWVGSVRSSYVTHHGKKLEMALMLEYCYNRINLHEKDCDIGTLVAHGRIWRAAT